MANYCKYYKQQRYVSYDNGITWQALEEYRKGALIQSGMTEGCEEPIPTNAKFISYLTDGRVLSAECDSNSTLTSSEITYKPSIANAIIGDCVTKIGQMTYRQCTKLTSVTLPSSLTEIGYEAFNVCSGLTNITIPSNVTIIADYAFNQCSSLTSITLEATTPPAIGSGAFNNTNNCPIYVPSGSVETYKRNGNWITYASRIQAIP